MTKLNIKVFLKGREKYSMGTQNENKNYQSVNKFLYHKVIIIFHESNRIGVITTTSIHDHDS